MPAAGPAEAGALSSLRVVPVRGPAMELSLAGPCGVGLGLRALRWFACVDSVIDASGFPYRPSFDGGLGRCTGAVSCRRRHLSLRVGGCQGRVPCVCACARPSWPGREDRPPRRVLVRLTFPLAALCFIFARLPPGWDCSLLVPLFAFFLLALFPLRAPVVSFFLWSPAPGALGLGSLRSSSLPVLRVFFCAPPLSLPCSCFGPRVPWALALCVVFYVGLPLLGSSCALTASVYSAWPLAAPWWLLPPLPFLCLVVFVAAARCSVFFCAPSLSLAFSGYRPRQPWALALCDVYFVGVPLLGSSCALAAFVFSAWPLAAPWWLQPPPPFCVSRFSSLPLGAPFFFCSPSCLLLSLVSGPWVPWALALCVVCFVGLPPLGSSCALTAFVYSAWPLAAPWWLLPPPPLLFLAVFVAAARCPLFFFLPCFAPPCLLGARRQFSPSAPPPPPGAWVVPFAVCGALCCLVLPCCSVHLSGVVRCRVAVFHAACCAVVPRLAVLWAAARRAVFVGASVCVLCCAVGCCCLLCCVSGRAVRLGCSRCSLLSGSGLRCRVLCCAVCFWVRCCAALLRVVLPGVVLLCAVLFCCAHSVPLLVLPWPLALPVALGPCAVRSCVLQCSPALCALCCVCFVVVCWCVLFFAAVLFSVCVLGGRAVRSLSPPLWAVLCSAVLVRVRCAVCVVRAVAGAWCCGALLCVVLFPLVFCVAVLDLVARGCLLVACFGVGVPVWPRGLLPCGWCGLLWCPASLCRVLWSCAVAWCCAVVLCCRFAVLFVLALRACGMSFGVVLCCIVLLVVCAVFCPLVASVCCGALSLPAGTHKKH